MNSSRSESSHGDDVKSNIGIDSDDDDDAIKHSLETLLAEVKSGGSFATVGRCPRMPVPGLSIDGVGTVGLPLNSQSANAVIGVCHQAPFGKGSDTIVDESVRKTWELDPHEFQLQNPDWDPHVQTIARDAAKQLGISVETNVTAELYKLLLYEEGAMFKAHQDWRYADVTHEVKPVTSGYRFVIVYNLVQKSPGPAQSAASMLGEREALGETLAAWHRGIRKSNISAPEILLYRLDHQYTDASLKLDSLKGLDKVKVECLLDTCLKTNVGLYLASCEKIVSGTCAEDYSEDDVDDDDEDTYGHGKTHHRLDEDSTSSLRLKRMVAMNGNVLGDNIEVEEEDFVDEDPFGREPDNEDYEGYMGNWGPEATHFYYDSLAVLIPHASRKSWLGNQILKRRVKIEVWIEHLYNNLSKDVQVAASQREDLIQLCEIALKRPAFRLNDQNLFQKSLNTNWRSLDHDDFAHIGRGVGHFNLTNEETYSRVGLLLDRRENFNDLYMAVQSFAIGARSWTHNRPSEKDTIQLHYWLQEYMLNRMEIIQPVSSDDGITLAEMASAFKESPTADRLIAFAKKHPNNFAAYIAFVVHITDKILVEAGAETEFATLLHDICHTFYLSHQHSDVNQSETIIATKLPDHFPRPKHVALLLRQLLQKEEWELHSAFLERVVTGMDQVVEDGFLSFYLPLLAQLSFQDLRLDHKRRYTPLFTTIINTYRLRFIKVQPPKGDWACRALGCGRCQDCRKLDMFLQDPDLGSKTFHVGKDKRRHLHQRLDCSGHSHVTDRGSWVENLVVTKSQSPSRRAFQQWEEMVSGVKKCLAAMDQGFLKAVLGERYDELVNLRPTRSAYIGNLDRENPKRRRVEVVDLT
ncbi:MAG: hypothetical protein Q9219_007506 [cf. Caloplaca sp. 3 TL-2023]